MKSRILRKERVMWERGRETHTQRWKIQIAIAHSLVFACVCVLRPIVRANIFLFFISLTLYPSISLSLSLSPSIHLSPSLSLSLQAPCPTGQLDRTTALLIAVQHPTTLASYPGTAVVAERKIPHILMYEFNRLYFY